MPPHFRDREISLFRRALLSWYRSNKRPLPWRETADPYAIWLSEVMLQQTTVETVIPYYKRFLAKFPNLESVIKGQEAELLRLWSGLGYYSRIRNFSKAAKLVGTRFGGKIPAEKETLKTLPGIGEYTASAIASIAFHKPEAVVDGNVMRVVSRLFAYRKDIATTTAKIFFRSKTTQLLDPDAPGDFNQAMMELGATICTPTSPRCPLCAVAPWCIAREKGIAEKLPTKTKKMEMETRFYTCFLITRQGKILLRTRKHEPVLRGLWELPLVPREKSPGHGIKPVTHTIMNQRMKIYPAENGKYAPSKLKGKTRWVPWDRLAKIPLTTVTRKVLQATGHPISRFDTKEEFKL